MSEDIQPVKQRRWLRKLAGTFSVLILLATAAAGVVGIYYNQLNSNITADSGLNFQTGQDGPQPGAPINIVLMGSDTREGKNAKGYGNAVDIAGARSDTTILLHISGDRTRALAVSIPRDSLVDIPECTNEAGVVTPAHTQRFNEAFDVGGPSCTVKTIEELTGITPDHYAIVDFAGFKTFVNALGGVEVCLEKPVNDIKAKLNLPAGKSIVKGEQALGFVRARYSLSDGGDLGRIERQQEFLSSAMRKAISLDTLTNPTKLLEVLNSATKSLTTDPGLASLDAMREVAVNVSSLRPDDVTFATVPVTYNDDGGTVSWSPQADQLWSAIANDTPWPPPPTLGPDGKALTAAPADINVNITNASGVEGLGLQQSNLMTEAGYQVGVVSSSGARPDSIVRFNPNTEGQSAAARTVAAATGAQLEERSSWNKPVTLIMGSNQGEAKLYTVVTKKTKDPAVQEAKVRTAKDQICAS